MSSMNQKVLRNSLNKFIANAKKEFGDDLSYRNLYSYVKVYLESVNNDNIEESVRKKSSRKVTTEPGDIFDASLCHCRVWNKGFGKQCSNKPKEGGDVCGLHKNSINKYGGWSLGMYFDKQPSKHLFDGAGRTKKGDSLPWKDINEVNSRRKTSGVKIQDPKVMKLKDLYEQKIGRRPRGPKASDIGWLRMKLGMSSDSESESESEDDVEQTQSDEDSNDQKENTDEEKENIAEDTDGDETEELSDVEQEEKSVKVINSDGKTFNEIKYDGVTYYKCTKQENDLYEILNDEEDTVGWYKEDDGIISFDDGYDEIHEDHDDYNP